VLLRRVVYARNSHAQAFHSWRDNRTGPNRTLVELVDILVHWTGFRSGQCILSAVKATSAAVFQKPSLAATRRQRRAKKMRLPEVSAAVRLITNLVNDALRLRDEVDKDSCERKVGQSEGEWWGIIAGE
jgi:hypothetical protein